ncbi:hypothetical protein T4D_15728 [Trichinella pseudospiralis]|uniref:Uncharacterized protein n=1 Tax=Trichinella pseudospiralis TaxID=6337 RepID=A0A0V1FPH2_TRIPS|nr:hypothetical protein T4D_15728 [Trichinella pseudospiralis]
MSGGSGYSKPARTRQKPPIDTGVSSPSVDRSRGRSPVGVTNEPARESEEILSSVICMKKENFITPIQVETSDRCLKPFERRNNTQKPENQCRKRVSNNALSQTEKATCKTKTKYKKNP